jgi:hypothetical protein
MQFVILNRQTPPSHLGRGPAKSLRAFRREGLGPEPNLDWAHFSSHASAQACYEGCQAASYWDKFRLDGDGDGIACDALP